MRRSAILGFFMIIPAVLVLSAAPGCGKKDGGGKKGGDTTTQGKKGEEEGKKGGTSSGGKEALAAKLDGTIKGQVTYDGDPPKEPMIADMEKHKNKDVCLAGKDFEKHVQTWIVNSSNKGVANVVISLEPPAGKYFKIRDDDKKRKDEVKIDQPHCAFIPHVVALFPEYFDGSKRVPTGQKLLVVNDADVSHNTKITGDPLKNPPRNVTLSSKKSEPFEIKWQKAPLQISCDIHPWMNALAFTFDHPYFAVTDSDGNFKIENAPTGVELTVVAWHEAKKDFKKEPATLKSGDNTLNFKVSK